ncbi:sigma-54 interaction domain-containing protein [Noviherbaspirillum massiliense]|uniref:sigma-54 interaction domain-containing protein n=1 Tax=Noviherbaspirillum massiliense TaxID=1465823 RepID=UPI0002D8B37E|nr:sigma-54 dependent transcriptional regulator [Noviherbaspirillum massiliense]
MLYVTNSAPMNQTVLVPRISPHNDQTSTYSAALREHGLNLTECATPAAAYHLARDGCRVGLLILTQEAELDRIAAWEPFIRSQSLSWVGLISREIISRPRVRAFVSEHLFNFITIPAELEHISLTLRHAWGMAFMRDEHGIGTQDSPEFDADLMMVGKTAQMHAVRTQIRKVARTDASVLIAGPSGTGKELAALSIHRQSARKNAPFVVVNCGAIAPQLFQSELFGYEKGAFTGAHQRKIGRIEAAQGGTLFLDEIGDMPFDMQVNLLRFLQEKTIERVGGTEPIPIDVRVIAATHVDLAEAVRQGRFREDLYYRINVVCITLPPLAERGADIEDIAKHYFYKFAPMHNRSLRGFSRAAMEAMMSHSWPGNIRELVNRVQRATVMAEGRFIQPEDLGFERGIDDAPTLSLENARADAERMMIRRALSQSRNQISRAASLLGVSRVTLYRLIDKYNIRPDLPSGAGASLLSNAKPDLKVHK